MPTVILRDLQLEDIEDRYIWSLDHEVTKYLNIPDRYPPFTKEETKQWIEACIKQSNGYIQKAILTEKGQHIGWVDLKNFDKANHHAEVGITIGDRAFWGKGYGSAAVQAILQFGFTEFSLNKIWLCVDADNTKAIRSYLQNGFIEEGMMRQDRLRNGVYVDRVRMSILKHEFETCFLKSSSR